VLPNVAKTKLLADLKLDGKTVIAIGGGSKATEKPRGILKKRVSDQKDRSELQQCDT